MLKKFNFEKKLILKQLNFEKIKFLFPFNPLYEEKHARPI